MVSILVTYFKTTYGFFISWEINIEKESVTKKCVTNLTTLQFLFTNRRVFAF